MPDVPSADAASMMPRGAVDRLHCVGETLDVARRHSQAAKCCRCRQAAAAPSASPHRQNIAAAVAEKCQRDFRAAAVGRHRQQQRSALRERRELAPACGDRLLITAVGAIQKRGRCRRCRRIVGVERSIPPKYRRCRASRRRWRSAARCRPAHGRCGRSRRRCRAISAAADRQRPHVGAFGQCARNDLGRIDRRIAELRQAATGRRHGPCGRG